MKKNTSQEDLENSAIQKTSSVDSLEPDSEQPAETQVFLPNTSAEPTAFTSRDAFVGIFKFATPYVISRLAASVLGITNALIISDLDVDSIAAAPLITAIQFAITGTAMGILQSVAIQGGELNGRQRFPLNNSDIGDHTIIFLLANKHRQQHIA